MNRTHMILSDFENDDIKEWLEAFLLDRRIRHVSINSIKFYQRMLGGFVEWCEREGLNRISELKPNHLRRFLIWLEDTNHNAGGRHAYYRSIRAYLNFFEDEAEPVNWKNPITKVNAPKVPDNQIRPIPLADVTKLVATCDKSTFFGARDAAIFMVLLETGVRANELLSIKLSDIDLITGSIQIQHGKGGKIRVVLIGKRTRKAIRWWLRKRPKNAIHLFTRKNGDKLRYGGLRGILARRSKEAGITDATLHDFRRAFCLAQLQAGTPETTIARYMGHSSTQLIWVYAKQTPRDLAKVFHSIADVEL